MSTVQRFIFDTLSRIGTSILAGSLVSCLVIGRLEPLHIVLMLTGVVLTGFGFPLIRGSQ
ncbi:hypothetical protein [Eoetvoesiella caeni]